MSEDGVTYFFSLVIRAREMNCRQFVPRNVREALPNRIYTLPGKTTFSYSDMAVIGRVTAAEKGPAFAHVGEDLLEPVQFDDPSAAERIADVHVAVEEFFGSAPIPSTLVFQMGLLNADDPARFIDGLRSLGRIATALTARRPTGVLIPAEQGALIGRIDDSGRLTFPALAPEGEQFLAGITTVAGFRTAVSEAPQTVLLALPEERDQR